MLEHRLMQVDVLSGAPKADLEILGLCEGEDLPSELADVPGAAEAKTAFRKATLLRPDASRKVLVLGLGKPEELTAERLRVAAAVALKQAQSLEAGSIAWALPRDASAVGLPDAAGAIVEGTILASYRFDRFHTEDADEPQPKGPDSLALLAPEGSDTDALAAAARFSRASADGANRARELQDLPANIVNPTYLAERARQISVAFEPVSVEVIDRDGMQQAGMGGLVAVSKGTQEEPALIALRYSGGADGAPALGLVGKAVTFDSGGISIKPSAKMEEMKMDMSGGAAVLEAVATIAELGLPVNVVAVIPSTENMPSGTATRPGDIITQLNGKTVEVNNTDAEGRLILADALTYCVREMGAERVVDLATLTGAVLIALGSTYAALISNDDEWASAVAAAGEETGEIAWRLPLHDEYKELTKGKFADLTNASAKRKAGTIYAGSFLEEFVDGRPWVHLDIAGTAWDVGREYVGSGATGYGVRLLTALARAQAS
jgi:leucyl aminopeptidase